MIRTSKKVREMKRRIAGDSLERKKLVDQLVKQVRAETLVEAKLAALETADKASK